jgi:hypothetical protein
MRKQNENVYVDHVFMLAETAGGEHEIAALRAAGFIESSRRSHAGLGTSNVFFCFDNVFVEVLWIASRAEARESKLGRHLLERCDGRAAGAVPFGIGFRTYPPEYRLPFQTWEYLPPGVSGLKPVQIATSSDDLRQPLLFRAQRLLRPDEWTDGKAGARQRPAGFAEVLDLQFIPRTGVEPSPDLQSLANLGVLTLGEPAAESDLVLTLSRTDSSEPCSLSLRAPHRLQKKGNR